jgi:hypothetical protein
LQVTTNCLRSCITNPTMEAVLANACLKPTRGSRSLEHIRDRDMHIPCVPKEQRSCPRRVIPEVCSNLPVFKWLMQISRRISEDKAVDTVDFKLEHYRPALSCDPVRVAVIF